LYFLPSNEAFQVMMFSGGAYIRIILIRYSLSKDAVPAFRGDIGGIKRGPDAGIETIEVVLE